MPTVLGEMVAMRLRMSPRLEIGRASTIAGIPSRYMAVYVSERFAGMTPIKRHRMVNAILQKEFDDGLHALQLSTKTPAEWERTNK